MCCVRFLGIVDLQGPKQRHLTTFLHTVGELVVILFVCRIRQRNRHCFVVVQQPVKQHTKTSQAQWHCSKRGSQSAWRRMRGGAETMITALTNGRGGALKKLHEAVEYP